MNKNPYRGSAEIIPFPVRARPASGEPRELAKPMTKLPVPRTMRIASGSGWDHEAAIQDAERSRNN